jgi:hypothetical protein
MRDAGLVDKGDPTPSVHEAEPHWPVARHALDRPAREVLLAQAAFSLLTGSQNCRSMDRCRSMLKVARQPDVHQGRRVRSCLARLGCVYRLHEGTYPHHGNVGCREWQSPSLLPSVPRIAVAMAVALAATTVASHPHRTVPRRSASAVSAGPKPYSPIEISDGGKPIPIAVRFHTRHRALPARPHANRRGPMRSRLQDLSKASWRTRAPRAPHPTPCWRKAPTVPTSVA